MPKSRSKLRTIGQRIGEKGENIFRTWATDNNLVPQKVERDYGIDFFCQVMEPVDLQLEESTGLLIGVQVRSVAGKSRPRVVLDKVDVESALRLSIPYCLVAVDTEEKKIYYLFLNEDLLREFHSFIHSEAQTKSLRLDRFGTSAEDFKNSLPKICSPAIQNRLKLIKTELKIASDVPGASLKIIQNRSGGIAIVEVPWIMQVFQIDSEKREKISTKIFSHEKISVRNISKLPIKKSFESIKPLVDGPVVYRGVFEKIVELYVKCQDEYKTDSFMLRRVEDERAYINDSGLILTISDPRLHDGLYKHFMGLRIKNENTNSLGSSSKTLNFLKMLQPGCIINEVGRDGISVENWPGLERIGPFVSAIQKVYDYRQRPLSEVFLSDIQDQEFGMTITLLELMINQIGFQHIMPGFLLGPAAGSAPKDDFWFPATFKIPIIANLKENGIEVWIEGRGDVYIHDAEKVICGFRVYKQEKWNCILRDSRFDKGPNPEVLACENWPAIPLFVENMPKSWSFKGNIQHPLKGEIQLISVIDKS